MDPINFCSKRCSLKQPAILLAACLATAMAVPSVSTAQSPPPRDTRRFEQTLDEIRRDTRLRALPDVPAEQRALIDYGGLFTFSYLSADDSQLNNRAQRSYDLTGYARINLDGANELYIRGRTTYRDYNSGDQFADEEDHLEGFLEEGYYRFDLRRSVQASTGEEFDNNFILTAGRQYTKWASGLSLAATLDGIRAEIQSGPVMFDLLAGVTTFGTADFDNSRPEFDDTTYRGYFGGKVGFQLGQHTPYAYVLVQRDFNPGKTFDLGITQTEFEYNSYYLGAGSDGFLSDKITYSIEGVFEGGDGLSNSFNSEFEPVPQEKQDIQAYAAQLALNYIPGDRYRSRWSAGVVLASGDNDRGDSVSTFNGNRPGTDDNAFNALGLVENGLAFAPQTSNILIFRAGVLAFPFSEVRPLRQLQAGTAIFVFNKYASNAPIDETSTDSRYLGFEPDFFINWQMLEDVTLTLRYGIFFPGEGVVADDEVRQFIYAGITYAF